MCLMIDHQGRKLWSKMKAGDLFFLRGNKSKNKIIQTLEDQLQFF